MQLFTVADVPGNRVEFVPESRPGLNRRDRILQALGSGSRIPKVDEALISRYYEYLTEYLCMPFLAHYPKPATVQEEAEFHCTVSELLDPARHLGDGFDGIFCKTCKGKYEMNLPLIDLYLPEDSLGFQLIDDYWYWFWNWR